MFAQNWQQQLGPHFLSFFTHEHIRVLQPVLHLHPDRTKSSDAFAFSMLACTSQTTPNFPPSLFHPLSVSAVTEGRHTVSYIIYILLYTYVHKGLSQLCIVYVWTIAIPGNSILFLVAHFHIFSTHLLRFQCKSKASIEGIAFMSVSALCLAVFLIVDNHSLC